MFLLFIPAKPGILGYIPNPLDVNDSLHCRPPGGDCDEVVAFGYGTTCALASTESTAAATLRLLTGGSLRRTKVDLTRCCSKSSRPACSATTGSTRTTAALSLHSLAKCAHPGCVTALAHCVHGIAKASHRCRIHSRKISSCSGRVSTGCTK